MDQLAHILAPLLGMGVGFLIGVVAFHVREWRRGNGYFATGRYLYRRVDGRTVREPIPGVSDPPASR